jgi:hypothetical protein
MDPGSHVEFQISTKNTILFMDHLMNISGIILLVVLLAHLAIGHVSFCHG